MKKYGAWLAALVAVLACCVATPAALAEEVQVEVISPDAEGLQLMAGEYQIKAQQFMDDPRWADGVSWPSSKQPVISDYNAWGCAAYAADFVKYVYGTDNLRSGTAYSGNYLAQVRAGDILHFTYTSRSGNSEHWIVVLDREGNRLYTAEGAFSSKVRVSWEDYWLEGNTLKSSWTYSTSLQDTYHHNIGAGAALYPDVPLDAWYAEELQICKDAGLISGYSDGRFGVGDDLTRAQVAMILWRSVGEPTFAGDASADTTGIADLRTPAWYTAACNWAVATGTITGYTDEHGNVTRFAPNDNVTVEQLIAIIGKANDVNGLTYPNAEKVLSFSDGRQVSQWARGFMAWGIDQGLTGAEDFPLTPKANPTREEAAIYMARAATRGLL